MRSFDAVKLVLDHAPKDLTPIQRLVLIQIAHRQPNCIASVPKLAADIGIRQPKTISRATRELADRGLITVTRRYMNSNQYDLNVRAFDALKANDAGAPNIELKSALTPSVGRATPVKQTSNKQDNKASFQRFWDVYPRHDSRSKAEDAFSGALLKVASDEVLITAARAFRDAVRDTPVRFVPLAVTWLRDERWLDDFNGGDDWDLDVYR